VSRTVLVVDDSTTLRQMLAHVLRLAGFDVLEAADGEHAVLLALGNVVDAVITDHNMPGMNGLALVRLLRGMGPYGNTPILVLTTDSSVALRQAGRACGATGWMVKPFDPEGLVELLHRVMA
jgi:two-component system, chemotaxis family, chemotaxis protein CheY